MERLSHFLWPCDIARVLQLPHGPPEAKDCSYWFRSKNGRFTVRSCYYQILSRVSVADSSSSGHSLTLSSKEWRWLWGLQLPLKVRTFLWRACHDILSVRVALKKRHLGGDPFCSWCNLASESTAHPFFECPRFVQIWVAATFNITIPGRHTNFTE